MSKDIKEKISYNDLKDKPSIQEDSGTNYCFTKIGKIVQLTLTGCTSLPTIPDGYVPKYNGWQMIASNNNDPINFYVLAWNNNSLIINYHSNGYTGSYKLYGTFIWIAI